MPGRRRDPEPGAAQAVHRRPEFVVTFFEFLAEQVRRDPLAELGFRSIDEAIGHAELLDTRKAVDHWKAAGLDLLADCGMHRAAQGTPRRRVRGQDHGLDIALDQTLIQLCEGALLDARPVTLELPVRNVNRTVGTMLGSMVTRRFGGEGLPDGTIDLTFGGSAGQSLRRVPAARDHHAGWFGDANDYVGKGLSGGRIVVRPGTRGVGSPPRTTSSPATSSATAPPGERSSCAVGSVSRSACATPAHWPSSRAWATTPANTT